MTPTIQKHEEIKSVVETLYSMNPDWITFYREILGLQGIVRRAYPTLEEMAEFEQTEAYRQIHRWLAELRRKPVGVSGSLTEGDEKNAKNEDTKVITVRLPQSLHDALRIEAFERRTSMNKLCVSKLLQFIDTEVVPASFRDEPQREIPPEDVKESEVGL